MTEPSNLRDAAEVTVTEADQSAAEAWLNANNGEWIDALNLAEAFARHRAAVEAATIAKVVAWLRDGGSWEKPVPSGVEDIYWDAAKDIEAGEWKQ